MWRCRDRQTERTALYRFACMADEVLSFLPADWPLRMLALTVRAVGRLASVPPTTPMSAQISQLSPLAHHQCTGVPGLLEIDSQYRRASVYWQAEVRLAPWSAERSHR